MDVLRPHHLLLLLLPSLFAGCAVTPPADPALATRQRIVRSAESLLGAPYVYGGHTPAGVDCSGLVHYAYRQVGLNLPRDTLGLYGSGRPTRQPLPGDLLFFRIASGPVDHVGIYAGGDQMIHASSGSGQVRRVSLNSDYWRRYWVGTLTLLDARPARPAPAELAFAPRLSGLSDP
ncbi:MAG TPA: C40 family peptidase [Candidatus Competibacteraceae bacterium]|nr:C40 family peptidase [Candidatus Competibacteraceae bacterium]